MQAALGVGGTFVWAICCAACAGGGAASDARPRPERKISATDGSSHSADAGRPSLLHTVVSKIILPTRPQDYAADLDGNGTADNQLGAIQAAISSLQLGSYDFQGNLDRVLAEGSFLLLFELLGRSLTDDAKVTLDAAIGVELDVPPDPSDNFSGSEPFAVSSNSPPGLSLDGVITGARLSAGPGTVVMPLPSHAGTLPKTVSLQHAQATADVSTGGLQNGRLRGGVPWEEVDRKFIPMIAKEATARLQDPSTAQNIKNVLTVAFDSNKDGTISSDEIRQCELLKLVLKPDVDLDGDKTPESLSVGLAFTAVPCQIRR